MKNKITTLILVIMCSLASMAQVGIGTNSPNANAALDVVSTTQGILFPRMTTAERDLISSPAEGLTIFNTTTNAMQTNTGTTASPSWRNWSNGFEDNTTCTTKVISVTSCASVTGTTLNDDANTADGTEYDWTGATGFVDGGTTQALVEIGGQCWYRRNAVNTPSAYNPAPTWANNSDVGWSGDYTGGPFTNEGKLYQWSAAMNGSTTERAQGVCPTGWHVPSDCEWMYLENTLGMTTAEQQVSFVRNSGNVGGKLSTLTRATSSSSNGSGSNSSGFTALLAGFINSVGTFFDRTDGGHWWSSSEASATSARGRSLSSSEAGVIRSSHDKASGFSVRCLKD
jgi:uncharacterized protein (TIGR02145 family)